ncbi:HD-GYP domain-containing protein [Fervidobacterium sp.]
MKRKAFLLSGSFLLGYALLALTFPGEVRILDAAFFVALALLMDRMSVPSPSLGNVSLHFLAAMAGAYLFPPFQAGLVAGLGLLPRSKEPHRELFNRSQVALAAASASAARTLLGDGPGELVAPVAYLGINTGAMLLLSQAVLGIPWQVAWRKNVGPLLSSLVFLAPGAYLMARLYQVPLVGSWGGFGVLIAVFPFSQAWWAWRLWREMLEVVESAMRTVVRLLEARDAYTALHSERVAAITQDLARELGLPYQEQERIVRGAEFHDIGKVGVPDKVLLKPAQLTPEEWEAVRRHPEIGDWILAPLYRRLGGIREVVLYHHERMDGGGYPFGLKGGEIPLAARIVAVADAYEAMTSDRPYRRALTPEEALARLEGGSGTQFDPEVVAAMKRLLEKNPAWKTKGGFAKTTKASTIGS